MGGIRSINVFILMAVAAAGVTGSLKQFYDTRQWFDLRNVIGSYETRPLYAGAIAAAFNNDARARKYLNEAIRSNPSAATVKEAREILVRLYAREGLYKETVEQLDGILRIKPNRDMENTRAGRLGASVSWPELRTWDMLRPRKAQQSFDGIFRRAALRADRSASAG
jgi:hypothetical protein